MNTDLLPDEPSDLEMEPIEPADASDLDYVEMPCTDGAAADCDDSEWEVFVGDDDERAPEQDSDDLRGDEETIADFDSLHTSPALCRLV